MAYCGGMDIETYRALPLRHRIITAFRDVQKWGYGEGGYPFARPGLPGGKWLVGPAPNRINCSMLTAYLLSTAFPHAAWDDGTYAQLQIMGSDLWSPMAAVQAAGVATKIIPAADDLVPGWVVLTQAWKSTSPPRGGHARLCEVGIDGDTLIVWESTNRAGPDGAPLGPSVSVASWDDLRQRYPAGIRAAVLRDSV